MQKCPNHRDQPHAFNAVDHRSDHARHHRERAAQRALRDGRDAVPHRHVARHPRAARRLSADRRPRGPMVVGQFGSFIDGFLQRYDGDIEEGDIFLTNDPYTCEGAISHPNDWLVLLPIFRRPARRLGRDVRPHDRYRRQGAGLPADRRHHDLRGRHAIPPVKIYRKGELQRGYPQLILHQCRMPTLEPLRLQRHHRRVPLGRAARASRCATASATTSSSRRWKQLLERN